MEVTKPGDSSVEEVSGLLEDKASIDEVTRVEAALVVGRTESERSGRARLRYES